MAGSNTGLRSGAVLLVKWMRRDFRVRVSQTLLGSVWALAQPLALTGGFVFLLRGVAQIETPVPYASFVYSGMLLWTVFSSGIIQSTNAMTASMYIASKASYPRIVAPISGALLTGIDLGVGLILLPGFILVQGVHTQIAPVQLGVSIAGTLLMTMGLGTFFSALAIFVRDARLLLPLVLQVGILLTPVAYDVSRVPRAFAWAVRWNPIATFVSGFRGALFPIPGPTGGEWVRAWVITSLVAIAGAAYFRAVEGRFADVA